MSELDRNLEALVRAAAAPPRPAAAKARFLAGIGGPRRRPWAALAASALAVAGVLAAVLRPPDADPPRPRPARSESPPRDLAATRVEGDGRLALRLRLPSPDRRRPTIRLDATATLPERTVLTLDVHRDEEELAPDGSLRPCRVHAGGQHLQVKDGRFDFEEFFPQPGHYRFSVTVRPEDHPPDLRPRVQALACRDWTFQAPVWDDGLVAALEPALRELDAQAEALRRLLVDYAGATRTEERWAEAGPALVRRAEAVVAALESSPASRLLCVGAARLVATARNLAGDPTYFKWEAGAFKGPVTYYDGGRMKTFRGDPWTFEALGAAVAEARQIAEREAGLWILREHTREGRQEAARTAARALSARPALAVLEGLRDEAVPPSEIEAALRRAPAR